MFKLCMYKTFVSHTHARLIAALICFVQQREFRDFFQKGYFEINVSENTTEGQNQN